MFGFTILHRDKKSKARFGVVATPHGSFSTPAFLPVGTQASIKSLIPEEIKQTKTEAILANTYHLFLRPGAEIIGKLGGLHSYMNWSAPMMTDSAGFQVFSLGFGIEHEVGKMVSLYGGDLVLGDLENKALVVRTKLCKIEEEGPTFISHLDGSGHFFPPERSIEVQIKLGADLIVCLDECTSPLHDFAYTKAALARTNRWQERSLEYFKKRKPESNQTIFGVIQGGPFEDLRKISTRFVADHDFFGIGIGGALINSATMVKILKWIHPFLPSERPRHLFGIGTIPEIFTAVEQGVDMFDCVIPTRLGRMGHVLLEVGSRSGILNSEQKKAYKSDKFRLDITKACFLDDPKSIDPECGCYSCRNFSRGYLCHLFRSRELLGYRLATIHNIFFMQSLMEEIREAIENDGFDRLKKEWSC